MIPDYQMMIKLLWYVLLNVNPHIILVLDEGTITLSILPEKSHPYPILILDKTSPTFGLSMYADLANLVIFAADCLRLQLEELTQFN